jgi:hypothetical protein
MEISPIKKEVAKTTAVNPHLVLRNYFFSFLFVLLKRAILKVLFCIWKQLSPIDVGQSDKTGLSCWRGIHSPMSEM